MFINAKINPTEKRGPTIKSLDDIIAQWGAQECK
jgi:hypothetical protein